MSKKIIAVIGKDCIGNHNWLRGIMMTTLPYDFNFKVGVDSFRTIIQSYNPRVVVTYYRRAEITEPTTLAARLGALCTCDGFICLPKIGRMTTIEKLFLEECGIRDITMDYFIDQPFNNREEIASLNDLPI